MKLARSLITVMLTVLVSCLALAQPNTVYVFNDGDRDPTNQFAKAYIWQKLGLNEPNGKPGTIHPDGSIKDSGGNLLGHAIKNGQGQVIGYSNSDGSKEAYDVTVSPTREAWMRVADNGHFIVMKHGARKGGTDDPAGGGIHLDGGGAYDGFREGGQNGNGTNNGMNDQIRRQKNGPYDLPPRPGANIKVTLYVCNGGKDPDGELPNRRSVAGTAGDVPGVGPVQSWPKPLGGSSGLTFGGTQAQVDAARRRLKKAAKKSGFRSAAAEPTDSELDRFVLTFPADERFARIEQIIAGTGATVSLHYSTEEPMGDDVVIPPWSSPMQAEPGFFTRCTFEVPITDVTAELIIEPGDLTLPDMFKIAKVSDFSAPLGEWGSGVFDFRELGVQRPSAGPLTYRVQYLGNPLLAAPTVFDFQQGRFVPVPSWHFEGDRVVFDASGAQVCAVVELADQATTETVTALRGTLLDWGIWTPGNGSEFDAQISNYGLVPIYEGIVSALGVGLLRNGAGTLADVRGQVLVDQPAGVLQVQFLNRASGLYVTVGTASTGMAAQTFRVENVPLAAYLDADGRFRMRLRSVINSPTVSMRFITSYKLIEVTTHN